MFHATELYGQNARLFRTVPVRSPTSTAPLRASQGDLTACRCAGLPVRPRQAQDARLLACISTRILSVPLNFRYKVLRELKKIKMAWPELNYTTAPGVLILHPSTPAIAPIEQAQLTS